MSHEFKKGDRVRVTFEATVADIGAEYYWFGNTPAAVTGEVQKGTEGLSVEKIEPPVEVFKAGDFVRSRDFGSYWYLAPNGYVRLAMGEFRNAVEFHEYEVPGEDDEEFTSEDFERVTLVEPPL